MNQVAQEEAVEIKPVAVEAETSAPKEEAAVKAVEGVVEKAAVAVETSAEKVAARTRRLGKTSEGKVASEKAADRVDISDAEKLVVLRMENEFLKAQQQIAALQKQSEGIQKNFPEYIKTLASKYSVDLTTSLFDSVQGAFTKKQ